MAWPTPDLDGLLLTDNSNGRRWLHALCRAVNEREGCLGLTKTQFMKADGSEAADIAFDDLLGGWIGGANDCAITNLNRCMAGVKGMITATPISGFGSYSLFMDESGSGGTGYTLSSLQSAVGLGAFPDETPDWANLNFWKQIKGALDLMLFCRKQLAVSRGTVSQRIGADSNSADAWAAAYADTPATVSGAGTFHLGFLVSGSSTYLATFREGPSSITINSTALSGVLTESYLNCQYVVNAGGSGFPAGWTVGSLHVTSTVNGNLSTPDITLGNNDTLTVDCDSAAPSTQLVPTNITANGTTNYADLYFDIAGELEDQA